MEDIQARMKRLRGGGTPEQITNNNTLNTENSLQAKMNALRGIPLQTVQPAISQPNFANHASMSQQGHNNIAQKQATIDNNITKPMTSYLQNGGKIDINDTASLAQLAREQGVQDTNYLQGRQEALNQPTLQQQYKVLPGSTTSVAIPQNNIAPVEAYDTNYGKNEAKSVTDNLKVTNENQNADVYLKAKSDLAEAQANNDKRGIAKNEAIIEDYKKKYLASYDGTKKDYSITSIRKHLQQQGEDINKAEQKWQNATTDEEKQRATEKYQDAVDIYNRTLKNYQEAVVYDETINNNLLKDTAKSFDTGFLGGVAKIEGGSYALASKLGGLDATTINADSLLDYNNGKNFSLQDVTNGINLLNPTTNMMTKATGISEGPLSAYLHLKELASLSPTNKRLANLYNEITNRTYKGTKEELANELDQIQKELYQDFKDRYTQGTLDKEREQLEHNENVYGKYAMLPNAVNTVANMLPSQMLTPIGGEALSLGAMGVGAGQQAMDEALERGARYNQAFNYGVASGATEVATEKMFESGLNKALGIKGTIDPQKLAGKLIDKLGIENKIAKAVTNTAGSVAGEMTEEMVSEAVNPLWKFLTYDKDGLPKNGYEYAKSILEAGIEAIPSTLLMEGMGGGIRVAKVSQIEQGIIQSINTSDLSPIVKNQLISEVRKASTDVKLGLEEADLMTDKAYEKYANLSAQSEQMKQRIPEGYSLPQSTIDILSYTENNRPGLNIAFDTNIQGNGTFVENPDGTRTITLNPNSKRAVEFTLTHELGHDLKGTAEYEQLQNLLMDYAKGKPNYQKSLNALDKTYRESGANYNLQDEATNDMLGQAIGEQEFYNKLAENPTLFNRVTNELKNLLGDKDTKLKNKIEKLTSNALKQEYKGNDNQVRSSLGENENEVLTFKAANGDNVEIIKNPTDVMLDRFENDAKKKYASEYIGERPDNNILRRTFDNKGNVYYWAAADMAHEPIEKFLKEKNPGYNFSQHPEQIIENYNPSENYYYRETRYSLSEAPTQDNQGRQLSEGQQEYFKDSKARDENGNLLAVYHGTPVKEHFTIFNKNKASSNKHPNLPNYEGIYFTNNPEFADAFAYEYKETDYGYLEPTGEKGQIYEAYLNITNPLNLNNLTEEKTEELYNYIKDEKLNSTSKNKLINDIKRAAKYNDIQSIKTNLDLNKVKEAGYDGLIADLGDRSTNGKSTNTNEYIVFEPNQIKNVTNKTPTNNPDIRYSLSEETTTQDNQFREAEPTIYTLNKNAIQNIADKIGTDYSSVEANIGETINDAKSYLSRNNKFIENYAKENNIPVSKAKEPVNFFRLNNPSVQQFVKNNNLDVKTLANDPQLVDRFLDSFIGEGADDAKQKWKNLFEHVKDTGDIPSPLKAVEREMKYIRDGITEIERDEISNEEAYKIYKSKDFQNYLENYLQNLFDKHEYTVDEVMEEAKSNHGTTDDYGLGAYMTPDGELLNFNYGGYRDDHRSINAFGMSMQDFMDYGAIRMKPEGNGFEIAIEPTPEQYTRLADYIDTYLKGNGDIYVDIDTAKGHEDISKGYVENTPTERIINDIKTYFRTGEYPSSRFAFSKQNNTWQQFLDDTYGKWNTGTKTNFEKTDTTMLPSNEELQEQESKGINAILKDLKIPTNEELQKTERESVKKEPIVQANKITSTKRLDDVRDFKKVGDRKVNAYQYDNPEVKPFFQQEAKNMLYDLNNAIKGERTATWDDYGELHYSGVTRETVQDIADLLDGKNGVKLSYADIEKGLNAIIEDKGSENIAAAKRIEMVLDKRLREGYTDSYGTEYEPNDNYLNFLAGKDFIDPAEYDKQVQDKLIADYEAENDDGTLFSLSEEQQKEVSDYVDKIYEDNTLDEEFRDRIAKRLNTVDTYSKFEDIKQEVEDYKDKMYKGISGLEDIANLKPEDVKQREMMYKQRKDKNTTNQRKFFDNMETSSIIAEQTKNNVNATTYEQKANLDTLEEMRQKLDERGNDLVEEWKSKQKNFTGKDVALGAILIERYQQEGDWQSAARTVEKLADMGTEAGRAVQMYSIFQRLSPETMAIYQQKALDKAFEEMKQRKTGKWVEANKDKYNLTAEDTQFIYEQVEKASQAVDEETKQRELSKIENRINEKLPPEDGQTIKALRRIAMLFNPKTQVRNIVGNAVITPVNDVADFIGSKIDKLISKKTKVRTTNNPNLITKAKGFKKGIKDAITDYKTGTRTVPTGSKYEFDFGARAFDENTNNKTLNAINRKLNGINDLLSAVMSGGDRPFYEAAYQNSLEGQMKANKVTEPTQEMIDIAVNEALQRTWNDDNEYTKAVLGIRRAMNHINIHGFGLGDLIIPFAKTPANLTKAMVEYSPVGFLEAAYDFNDMRKAISRGEMTPMQQKRFVNATSKAITGSMLYLIAGMLVKSGRITGSADDDKDVKNFEQNVLGIQPYSVKVGDKTYTYSWMNPINAPLAIAADTYKMSKENASKWDIIKNAFKVAGETLVDNSFLSGIKELFSKDSISEGLIDAIESFPESLMPTFMSQIASLGDKTQRQTFEYQNDFKTISNKIKNKVPGARNTLEPQVNTFGEEIENQNTILNAFINPANVREARITDEQKALYDVYLETKDKTIFPMQAPYYTNTDNGEKKNLSSKDRVDYQKASGKYVNDIYKDLFKNDRFIGSSNEEKVKILHEIAKDGNTKGREKVGAIKELTNSNLSKLNENIESLEDAGIPLADFYIAWYAKSNHALGKTHAAQKKAIRDYTDLTSEQENVLYEIFNIK